MNLASGCFNGFTFAAVVELLLQCPFHWSSVETSNSRVSALYIIINRSGLYTVIIAGEETKLVIIDKNIIGLGEQNKNLTQSFFYFIRFCMFFSIMCYRWSVLWAYLEPEDLSGPIQLLR